jgi:hypothetical protein
MKSHTGSRLGFDEGPSTDGFTAAVITLFVIVLPQNQNFYVCRCSVWSAKNKYKRGFFGLLSFYVRYSTLLPMPPFRFH